MRRDRGVPTRPPQQLSVLRRRHVKLVRTMQNLGPSHLHPFRHSEVQDERCCHTFMIKAVGPERCTREIVTACPSNKASSPGPPGCPASPVVPAVSSVRSAQKPKPERTRALVQGLADALHQNIINAGRRGRDGVGVALGRAPRCEAMRTASLEVADELGCSSGAQASATPRRRTFSGAVNASGKVETEAGVRRQSPGGSAAQPYSCQSRPAFSRDSGQPPHTTITLRGGSGVV